VLLKTYFKKQNPRDSETPGGGRAPCSKVVGT